jgi:hypothetical protein
VKRVTVTARAKRYISLRDLQTTAKDISVITLTFLMLLAGLAWLAQAAWQRARTTFRMMALPRGRSAIADNVLTAQSLA